METKYRIFEFFFKWKLRSIHKFWTQNHSWGISRGWDTCETKKFSWLGNCDKNSNYLFWKQSRSKTEWNLFKQLGLLEPIRTIWELSGLVWASWGSLGQVIGFWGHYEIVWILIDLFQKRILYHKYLGRIKSDRNGFVFKICIWISVFRRKSLSKNGRTAAVVRALPALTEYRICSA